MAEYVQLRTEETIPELEQMERIKLFERREIRAIANKRKELEYKIQRRTKCKEDFLRYIQYEMDLLKLIKLRRKKIGMALKKTEIEHAITNRVDLLFKRVIQRFQSDTKLWISHIKFCTEVGFTAAVSAILIRMLAVHSNKPNLWKVAANWEFDECNSIENARRFLLRGLRFHPKSMVLYKESFCMELKNIAKELQLKAEEKEEMRHYGIKVTDSEDSKDVILNGKFASIVLDHAIKEIGSVEFCCDLLDIAMEFNFTVNLQTEIINHLLTTHSMKEITWDYLAKLSLKGIGFSGHAKSVVNIILDEDEMIESCVSIYRDALTNLPTEKMWSCFLDTLLNMNKDLSSLKSVKQKLLESVLQDAHKANLLNEKYYLEWMHCLPNEGSQLKLVEIFEEATERFPGNINLWILRLNVVLQQDRESEGIFIFHSMIKNIGNNTAALPLWLNMIKYYNYKDTTKVEDIFKQGLAFGSGISQMLKPHYLDWLSDFKDKDRVHHEYNSMCLQPPLCLDLHLKMIELEKLSEEVDVKFVRKVFKAACHQFGEGNSDLWLRYAKFEIDLGDPRLVSSIYDQAIRTLTADLVEQFVGQYSLMKSEALSD